MFLHLRVILFMGEGVFASSGVGWADPPSDSTGNGQRAGGMTNNVINRMIIKCLVLSLKGHVAELWLGAPFNGNVLMFRDPHDLLQGGTPALPVLRVTHPVQHVQLVHRALLVLQGQEHRVQSE